jgi:hypothetical protein
LVALNHAGISTTPPTVAFSLPKGQELFKRLAEEHVGPHLENTCSKFTIGASMVEQHG